MRVILKKIRKMWEMKHMIENDWDKIREKILKLVYDYRDTYAE